MMYSRITHLSIIRDVRDVSKKLHPLAYIHTDAHKAAGKKAKSLSKTVYLKKKAHEDCFHLHTTLSPSRGG